MTEPPTEAAVRAYYEAEAGQLARPAMRANRLELRDRFIERMTAEHRRSIVDFGAGPGRDILAFRAAGLDATGLDLAVGNATLAGGEHGDGRAGGASTSTPVVVGSVLASPFRPHSFDAGWSMSTLMHLDADGANRALDAMVATVRPGGPILIGVWGGDDRLAIDDDTIDGQRRPFHLRSMAVNRAMLGRFGSIEHEREYPPVAAGQSYQTFLLRLPPRIAETGGRGRPRWAVPARPGVAQANVNPAYPSAWHRVSREK